MTARRTPSTRQTGKNAAKSATSRAKSVRAAGSIVKAKTSINFTRSVRGK